MALKELELRLRAYMHDDPMTSLLNCHIFKFSAITFFSTYTFGVTWCTCYCPVGIRIDHSTQYTQLVSCDASTVVSM